LQERDEILLRFFYQGKINPDQSSSEAQVSSPRGDTQFYLPPTYLYSSQSQWYPQLVSKPYSQVETSVNVPSDYSVIANGKLTRTEAKGERTVYSYVSELPVKYFSLLVGRLNGHLTYDSIVPLNVFYYTIDKGTAQQYAKSTDKILRFFTQYFGPFPYQNLNLVLRPADEPGGHAPATIVIANRVFSYFQLRFSKDPLYVPEYPEFMLAHEIAHQWWGQAVGWRNYRDQWLSEGFAQFAAVEYIRSQYGDEAWLKLSRIFYHWIEDKTYAGPIILGTRLGRLTNDRQAYSALLYNKGAYILNMLKNWMGSDNFGKALAEFYSAYQFKRASIQDFQKLAQHHCSGDLAPFFHQWLYGWDIPTVAFKEKIEENAEGALLKMQFQQPGKNFYLLKIPVEAKSKDGKIFRINALLDRRVTQIEVRLPFVPQTIQVDPLRETLVKITELS
jgi:aminopeptidase N